MLRSKWSVVHWHDSTTSLVQLISVSDSESDVDYEFILRIMIIITNLGVMCSRNNCDSEIQ